MMPTAPAARAASEIPAPAVLRLFGRWGPMLALARDPAGTLQTIYQDAGPIVTLGRGRSNVVMVLGPDAQHQLLVTPDLQHPVVFTGVPQRGGVRGGETLQSS